VLETLSEKQLRNLKDKTSYPNVSHFAEIWCEIVLEAFTCTRQSNSTNKQNKEHYIWECCCKVHNLKIHRHKT